MFFFCDRETIVYVEPIPKRCRIIWVERKRKDHLLFWVFHLNRSTVHSLFTSEAGIFSCLTHYVCMNIKRTKQKKKQTQNKYKTKQLCIAVFILAKECSFIYKQKRTYTTHSVTYTHTHMHIGLIYTNGKLTPNCTIVRSDTYKWE